MPNTELELTRLLSLISHEVRGPLGVVRGYLRLLQQQPSSLTEMHRHAVAAAIKAADRAVEILGQVSTLARFESGDVDASLAPTPLEPLLRATITDLVLPTEPRVTVQLAPGPQVSVAADESLLRPALVGLASAVIRAQVRDASVSVAARAAEERGQHGIAIVMTAIEPASDFEAAEPLDVSRGGLGLDLPIASFIISAHGGHVREGRHNNRFAGVVVWLPIA